MTGTFKANNPYNTFLLLLYGILLKMPIFLHPVVPTTEPTDGFLFQLLLEKLSVIGSSLPAIYSIITFLLLYTQAITFNQLANGQRLMQKPNYLTAMAYLLITSLFREWNELSAPLIVNSLLIWVWARMSGLAHSKSVATTLFNIGFVIGLSTFFYFPSIAFSALIIFGLLITRPFKFSEWLLSLVGIVTPYYFLLSYNFLTDRLKGYKLPLVVLNKPLFFQSSWALASICIVFFLSLVGLYYIRKNFLRQLVQTRKSWNLIFIYFIVAFSVPFINATHSFEYWILCAIPLSIFVGCAFLYPTKKWFPLLMHWLIVLFVIAFSYFVNK